MKKRTKENEDLILALKVCWKFTSTFGSDMSDVVNACIEDALKKYGEPHPNTPDEKAEAMYERYDK